MRDHRNYRHTRRNRNSPNQTHRPGSRMLQPVRARSRDFSPVRLTQRDDQRNRYNEGDRSNNVAARDDRRDRYSEVDRSMAQYSESMAAARGGESESASMKFRWNNLLEAKRQVENTKNRVGGYGYENSRFSDSGVVPIVDHGNFSHVDRKDEMEFQIPKNWEQIHQQQHLGYEGVSVSRPNASLSSSYFEENVHLHSQMMPKSNSVAEFPNNTYDHVKQCSVPVMNREFNYSEMQGGIMPHDHEFHYRNTMPKGDFNDQEFRRPSIVDSIVDRIDVGNSHGDTFRKGVTWEQKLSSQHWSPKYPDLSPKYPDLSPKYHDLTPKYHDFSPKYNDLTAKYHDLSPKYHNLTPKYRDLSPEYHDLTHCHSSKHCVDDILGCGNMHPEYAYTSNCQYCCCKGSSVLNRDQYINKQEEGNASKTEEQAMHDLNVDMYEAKCSGTTNENQVWTDLNDRQCASDSFDDDGISFDQDIIDNVHFDQRLPSPYSSLPSNNRNPRKHNMIIGKSMKKSRPGRIITFPNTFVSSSRNVRARLGPRVVSPENAYAGKNIKSKKLKKNLLDVSKTATCYDLSDVKLKVEHSKTDPPEDSKEFKQLVQNAFFKFVKLLNENPAQRRKYTDQGVADTLRCTLCGSESMEFPSIQSLAMHAFNSSKAQRRTDHLGFHKALCLLLGWSDTAGSEGLWVKKLLPEVELSNLKNDLIIWPPVVLVHNKSIAHHDLDKRMTVSIEGLQAILRDMGFGGGKTKVSRGKPGNFSILIVTFKATFSGLQEAKKLHKFYDDNKRGRTELQQINDGRGLLKDKNETQYIPGNGESALYGYLGNAQDLDKLDFESKKHSVVKSNKEIQAIADANLRAD
ncbi:hypothetical protein TanjilG_30168 [Lupinus angustifolius]|uniref:XS domain-containing protein n=2 Tax=Lupinus angustifolius TaxID=3871 RepID=A0A4P1R701_LUPAN|nr:PREDICTED: uncharacterized protein LOC109358913 [Lupinus angustifolius]OIW03892.1 hypothetical protein TanjilG_30168 [Lupinus angustifolius]